MWWNGNQLMDGGSKRNLGQITIWFWSQLAVRIIFSCTCFDTKFWKLRSWTFFFSWQKSFMKLEPRTLFRIQQTQSSTHSQFFITNFQLTHNHGHQLQRSLRWWLHCQNKSQNLRSFKWKTAREHDAKRPHGQNKNWIKWCFCWKFDLVMHDYDVIELLAN